MKCCCSMNKNLNLGEHKGGCFVTPENKVTRNQSETEFVVYVGKVVGIPRMKKLGKDAATYGYLEVQVVDELSLPASRKYVTLVREAVNQKATWANFIPFSVQIRPTDMVQVKLWHQNEFAFDEEVAEVVVAIDEMDATLQDFAMKPVPKLRDKLKEPVIISMRLVSGIQSMSDYTEKVLFLMRHAETTWMIAHAKKDVTAMARFDHSLSESGILQAEYINSCWKKSADELDAEVERAYVITENDSEHEHHIGDQEAQLSRKQYEALMSTAEAVYCSPLTRCIQTAMVAMSGHPCMQGSGLTISRHLRDKRNFQGSSQEIEYSKLGNDIAKKALENFMPGFVEDHKIPELLKACHTDDCDTAWWTEFDPKESHRLVTKRYEETMQFLKYIPEERAVVVGHAELFREVMKRYLAQPFCKTNKGLSKELFHKKLSHCNCLAIKVRFLAEVLKKPPQIVDAALMFGSRLKKVTDTDDEMSSKMNFRQ